MPGNKRPNRKPGVKKNRKPASTKGNNIGDISLRGAKHITKSFGPKPSRSPISPGMTRGSARNR